MNNKRREYSSLETTINAVFFISCVILFIVSLIIGFMKIFETVTFLNILLFIGFFFLDEVVCTLIWLVGYLLTGFYFSNKEEAEKQINCDTQGSTANIDIYDEDDDESTDSDDRDLKLYEMEKSKSNIM